MDKTLLTLTLRRSAGLVLALLWCCCSGCLPAFDSSGEEEKDPHFLAGRSRVSSMDYAGAFESFSKALEANPRSASAHKELGLLCYQRLNDHAAAIYHFQQLLRLRPQDPQAEFIRQNIVACKQELAKSIFFDPLTEKKQKDFEQINEENRRLRLETTNLLKQVVWLREQLLPRAGNPSGATAADTMPPVNLSPEPAKPVSPGAASASSAKRPTTREGGKTLTPTVRVPARAATTPSNITAYRSHTVRSGETIYSISKRYGLTAARLRQANPGLDTKDLRHGQVLNIPSR